MTRRSSKSQRAPRAEIQPRYPERYWDNAYEHLRKCYILCHDEDYLEFLVTRVWKLDQACRLDGPDRKDACPGCAERRYPC